MSVDISIVYGVLMAGCGLVASIWGVVKIIKEIKKPGADLAKQVKVHAQQLEDGQRRLTRTEEAEKMIMRCLLAQLDHQITGNNIDNLKRIRQELTNYLTQM